MTAKAAASTPGEFPSTVKPWMALVAMARFLANKEDTSQVFRVFDAIDNPQTERNFRRFENTPEGRRIIDEKVELAPILSDRAFIESLPAGSLGAAYHAFTFGQGLHADGLIYAEQSAKVRTLDVEPARRRFISSGFQLHDVWHVLGGWGRDAVGEACVLSFTYGQLDVVGMEIFARIMVVKEKCYYPGAPIFRMLDEARAMGAAADWLVAQNWKQLLTEDYDEVRRKLNIGEPHLYNKYKQRFAEVDAKRRDGMAKRGMI